MTYFAGLIGNWVSKFNILATHSLQNLFPRASKYQSPMEPARPRCVSSESLKIIFKLSTSDSLLKLCSLPVVLGFCVKISSKRDVKQKHSRHDQSLRFLCHLSIFTAK